LVEIILEAVKKELKKKSKHQELTSWIQDMERKAYKDLNNHSSLIVDYYYIIKSRSESFCAKPRD
jgi:hypothetical protein